MGYNIEQVREAVMNKWDWENPANNVSICVWGPPGVGKTWIIASVVAQRQIYEYENMLSRGEGNSAELQNKINRLKNYVDPKEVMDILIENMLVLRLAERPIEQIEGVPFSYVEKGFTRFLMPENLVYLKSAKWVVVFLDELDKASASKMAACTHLIESGCIGDFQLPLDSFLVAAANRTQDSFLSKPIAPELCNRMAHIELDPDVLTWIKWAAPHGVSENIINFHKFNVLRNENYFTRYGNDDNEGNSPRAFGSARSWFTGSKQMNKIYQRYNVKYGKDDNVDKIAFSELEQLVGEACSIEFITYLKLFSKVDIKKFLSGEQSVPEYIEEKVNTEESQTVKNNVKKEQTQNKREKVMSEQYIYAFALIEQLTVDMLSSKQHLSNLIKGITAMLPEIRTVFIQTINTTKKDVLRKIGNAPESEALLDEIINYLSD